VAVHDPEMFRDKDRCRSEGADILRDHNPSFRHGGLQHPLVIDAAETWPVRRQRDGVNSQRRHARHAVPARPVAPAPPGMYRASGERPDGPVPLTPAAQLVLHRCMREVQVRRDAHLGAEHIALALTWVDSGPVPPILAALDAPAPILRAAILDRYRQAS
jgi:hypothetical protein